MFSLRSTRILSLLLCTAALLSSPAELPARGSLPDAAADTMLRYTLVRETHGYNRSPEIDLMNRTAGVPVGSSWCMASVYTSYAKAARALGIRNPLKRTASCSQQLAYAKSIGSGLRVTPISKLIGSSTLRLARGAVMIMKSGGGSDRDIGRLWPGHTGLYLNQDRSGLVRTVEGNTSSGSRGSQRDGSGQFVRLRRLRAWLAAIEIPEKREAIVWPVRLRRVGDQFA